MAPLSLAFRALYPQQGWTLLPTSAALVTVGSTGAALFTASAFRGRDRSLPFLVLAGAGAATYIVFNLSPPLPDRDLPFIMTLKSPIFLYVALLSAGIGGCYLFKGERAKRNTYFFIAAASAALSVAPVLGSLDLELDQWNSRGWVGSTAAGWVGTSLFLLSLKENRYSIEERDLIWGVPLFLGMVFAYRWCHLLLRDLHPLQ